MVQSFVYIRLERSSITPHRQIWNETYFLPAGETVFLDVEAVEPLDTGDYRWFRDDLSYVVLGSAQTKKLWHNYISKLEAVTHL